MPLIDEDPPSSRPRGIGSTRPFIAGSGSVDLWVGSSTGDTDLEVTVTEVRPDGTEIYIQSGWLRASQRALDDERSSELRPVQTHLEADAAPLPEHVAGNWRAIAAAPDLLARLQRRVTACPCPPPRADGSDHCPDCLADMAVIAKALEG